MTTATPDKPTASPEIHELRAEVRRLERLLYGKIKALLTFPAFQYRVQPWLLECFGPVTASDKRERNHRFLEESLELVQSTGCTRSEAHQLVDYVFDRPAGEKKQEVGGVMLTLAGLCLAQKIDMHACGEAELARVWNKIEQIREKQAAKPKNSPLPAHVVTGRGE